ncbi:MAG: hypothetical protein ACRDJC_26540, partial [Thermomicrobiales bacterium]
ALLPVRGEKGAHPTPRGHKPLSLRTGRGVGVRVHWRTRRTLLVALLSIQALLAAIALAVWIWTPDAPPLPAAPEMTAPLAGSGATYESALPLAQAQADAWLPDAVLLNAAMQVDWPWSVPREPPAELPGTGWLTYAFVAPWDAPGRPPGAASLGVVIERLDGSIVSQETIGWEQAPDFRPPPPSAAIDSTAATLLAEEAGGTAFRRACPQYRHVSRTFPVAAGRTAWPQHWVVIYEDTRVLDQHGLLLRIDAETGEILDRSGDAPACLAAP